MMACCETIVEFNQSGRLDQLRGRLDALGDIIAQVFVSNPYLGYFDDDYDAIETLYGVGYRYRES